MALSDRISYGMPGILGSEAPRYAGKRVLVIGAGHSAAGNLIALSGLTVLYPDTTIVWAIRGHNLDRIFGGGTADQLPARGELGMHLKSMQDASRLELHTDFRLQELWLVGGRVEVVGAPLAGHSPVIENIDEIIGATGARPGERTAAWRQRLLCLGRG